MLAVAIQAGGESLRMGTDKALVPFLGRPLIAYVIERLSGLGGEFLVTTNHPERFGFLNIPLFQDILPGKGALSGLYTALANAQQPFVAVVACDMPFANPDLIKALQKDLIEQGADVAIPRSAEGYEPFHAVYRRETCLAAVRAALERGEKRMISWFPEVNVVEYSPEQVEQFDPDLKIFLNANTPEELRKAEEIARGN